MKKPPHILVILLFFSLATTAMAVDRTNPVAPLLDSFERQREQIEKQSERDRRESKEREEKWERQERKRCRDSCDSTYNAAKGFCSNPVLEKDPVGCLDNKREERRICRQGCDN